jgi:hypothetical protein
MGDWIFLRELFGGYEKETYIYVINIYIFIYIFKIYILLYIYLKYIYKTHSGYLFRK